MREEIEYLLKRDISSTQLSLGSGVNKTTIIKLRNGDRLLDNIKFSVIERLYLYELKLNGSVSNEEDIKIKKSLQNEGLKAYLTYEISRGIKMGREKYDFNAVRLSSLIGIPQQVLNDIETKEHNSTLRTIGKIFDGLDFTMDIHIRPKHTLDQQGETYHHKSKLK